MKTVLVTGGSRGIGKAISLKLGSSFNVAVGYASSKDMAEETVKEITASGGNAISVHIDVTDASLVDKAFTSVEQQYDGVDVLINNAGITKDNILPRLKDTDWDDVINTNLSGAFRSSQRAIKNMLKKKWGRIVFISSIVGITGNQGQANYAASKAGLIGLSRSISKEMGSRNITANVVAPGYIDTDMTSFLSNDEKNNIIEQLSIKRIGTPEDIANIVSFLCSDESEYITGQVIKVDGGLVI